MTAVSPTGCGDPSKSSSPPARTYGAPAARMKDAEQYSSAYGCNGNPYYYNYTTEKWVYFDDGGRENVSPLQPPCPGMRTKKVMGSQAGPEREKPP